MLTGVSSAATMSLKDSHGNLLAAAQRLEKPGGRQITLGQ